MPLLILRDRGREAELVPMGTLTPMRHPYLFGGGISGVLIAGVVLAFVSTVAVISQTDLPEGTPGVSTPPHGNLTIGAGRGIVGDHAGGSGPPTRFAFVHRRGAVSGPPTAANDRAEGSRGAPVGSSGAIGRANSGPGAGPQHGGPTPVNPGQGGQLPPPGDGSSGPGPGQVPGPGQGPPTAGPPGLAKKPSGLPPGLAKKPSGLPPGLAKKPDGLPPGHAPR